MAHYNITYACGHHGQVNLVGSQESREWRLRRYAESECFACIAQRATQEAQEAARQQELPPLQGTAPQIAWAETIRIRLLAVLDVEAPHLPESRTPRVLQAIDALYNETSAHRWIEWRDDSIPYILASIIEAQEKRHVMQSEARRAQDALKHAVLAAATMRPLQPVTEAIAEIHVNGQTITVLSPERREDFRELVRFELGYTWENGRWHRQIAAQHGTVEDRAAELGHRLLAAGFPVCILRDDIRSKAVAGDFAPECTRWIRTRLTGEYTGWFAIHWGWHEDFYAAAKRLKRSRYAKPAVVVPPEQWEEVLDFAHLYDFRLSALAQEVAEQAQVARDAALIVQKEWVPKRQKTVASGTPTHLPVPENVVILDEFREGA